MKHKLSAVTAAVAALAVGAVLFGAPAGAHEERDDDDGRRSDYGMMGHMMNHGQMMHMMHHGMMGKGMMGPGMGMGLAPCSSNVRAEMDRDLTVKDVTEMLQLRLDRWGNERLKLGKIEQKDDDTIIAEILTVGGSLVQRLAIDRDTGSQHLIK